MAAPKGNQFWKLRRKSRRVYESEDEMIEAINEYIENPPMRSVFIDGQAVEVPCYTVTGLALHLGFESRQSIYDYKKDDRFSYILKAATAFIENEYEKNLSNSGCTGSIFALKNMGWSDKSQVDNISSDGSMTPPSKHVYEIIDPKDE